MRRFAERHFEMVDLTIVMLLSSAAYVAGHDLNHDSLVLDVLKGNRAPVCGALAGLFGTIFGFAMTAISTFLLSLRRPSYRFSEAADIGRSYGRFSHEE